MATRLHINVTKRDIQRGTRGRATDCPVALAISRKLKNVDYVSVGQTCASWYTKEEAMKDTPLPPEVTEFIQRFDSGEPVEPIRFYLNE